MSPARHNSWRMLLALPAMLCVLAAGADQSAWLEIHSNHFTVVTDAGEKKGREVALRFEQMRAVFASLLTKDHLNQSAPLTIFAFQNDKSYYQAAPLYQGQPIEVPGFLLPGKDQNFILLNLSEEEPWRAVAHDFAHLLLDDNYPPAQGWFDEGLAEYFGSIRIDNKRVEIGGDPELATAASAGVSERDGRPQKSLTELLADPWIPIPELFAMKHESNGANENSHRTLYYAESWIVLHYLLHEKKLPETGAYFDLVRNQHVPIPDAIQKAYGVNVTQFEDAVKAYFKSQTGLHAALDKARSTQAEASNVAQPPQFPTPVGPDDSPMSAQPLRDADANALYAGIQVRIPERREIGLQSLRSLATTQTAADKKMETREAKKQEKINEEQENPSLLTANAVGNEIAHRALAWDHIQRAEFEDAITELGDSAALNQHDMWVRYYLSILKYRMAQAKHGDIQGLPNMMLDLRAVLEWYPEMAGAYDLLAMARNEGGSTPAAMQVERAAITLSPRNETYVYHLAQIYIAGKKWDAAQALLERLKNSENPQTTTLAQERLDQIGSERKYGLTGVTAQHANLVPQKSPFDVLDEDAAKRAEEEKAAQAATQDTRPTKFFKGRLVAIDCSHAPVAVLTIRSASGVFQLRAADYKSLLLVGADDFSCAWRDKAVTANYKPGGQADGDLVSLEVQ